MYVEIKTNLIILVSRKQLSLIWITHVTYNTHRHFFFYLGFSPLNLNRFTDQIKSDYFHIMFKIMTSVNSWQRKWNHHSSQLSPSILCFVTCQHEDDARTFRAKSAPQGGLRLSWHQSPGLWTLGVRNRHLRKQTPRPRGRPGISLQPSTRTGLASPSHQASPSSCWWVLLPLPVQRCPWAKCIFAQIDFKNLMCFHLP